MVTYLDKQNIKTIEIKDLINDIIDDKDVKDMFIGLIIHDLKSKEISGRTCERNASFAQ